MARLTPVKAIRAKCLDCSGDQPKEVRLCSIPECSLYPYRMGKRPTTETNSPAKNSEIAKEKTVKQQERILSGAGR